MSAMSVFSVSDDEFPVFKKSGNVITFTFRMNKEKFRKMATELLQEMDEEDGTLTEEGESAHSSSNSQGNVDLENSRIVEASETFQNLRLGTVAYAIDANNSQDVRTTFQEESSFADCVRSSIFPGETSDHEQITLNEETTSVQTKSDSESENWPEIGPFTETETVPTTEIKSEVCNGILSRYVRLELAECIVIKISLKNDTLSVDAVKYKEASKSRDKKALENSCLHTSDEVNEVKDSELEQKSFLDNHVEESSGFSNTEREMQPENLNERSINSGRDLTDMDDINNRFQVDSNEMAGKSYSPPAVNSLNESQPNTDEYLKAGNTVIENGRTESEKRMSILNLMEAEISSCIDGSFDEKILGSAGTEKNAESAAKSIIEIETVLFGNKSLKAPNITGDASPKSLKENFNKAENTLETNMHHAGNADAICSSGITNYDKDKFSCTRKSPVKGQMPELCIKETNSHSVQKINTEDMVSVIKAENLVREEMDNTAEFSEEIKNNQLFENHASKNEENNSTVMIQTENPRDIATDAKEINFAPKKNKEIVDNHMAMESPDDQASEKYEKKRAAPESTSRPEKMADTALEDSPDEAGAAQQDPAASPDEAGAAQKDPVASPDEAGAAPEEDCSIPQKGAAPEDSASSPDEEAGAAPEDSSSPNEEAGAALEDCSSPKEGAAPEDSASIPDEAGAAPEEDSSSPDEDAAPEEDSSSPDEEADAAPEDSSSPDEEADAAPEDAASSPDEEADAAPGDAASSPGGAGSAAPEDAASSPGGAGSAAEGDAASSPDEGAGAAPEDAASSPDEGAGSAPKDAASSPDEGAGSAPKDAATSPDEGAGSAPKDAAFRVVDEADISPEDTASRPDEEIDAASSTAFEDEETEIPEGGKGTNEDAAAEHAAFKVSTPEIPHTRKGELNQKNCSSVNVLWEGYDVNEKGISPEDASSEDNEKDNSQKNCLEKAKNCPSEDSSPKDEEIACLKVVNQEIETLPKEVIPEDGKCTSSESAPLQTTVEEVDAAPTRANRNLISPFKESVQSSSTEDGKRIKTRGSQLLNTGSASRTEKATRTPSWKSFDSHPSQNARMSFPEPKQKRLSIDSASSETSRTDRSRRSRTPEVKNETKIVARASPRRQAKAVPSIQEETSEPNTPNTRSAKSSQSRSHDAQKVSSVSTRRTKRAT